MLWRETNLVKLMENVGLALVRIIIIIIIIIFF